MTSSEQQEGSAVPTDPEQSPPAADEPTSRPATGAEALAQPSDPTQDPTIRAEILSLRGSIDNIDASLMYLLAERFKCTQRVGELKAQGGVAPADPVRESQQIERLSGIAREAGLDPEFAEEFRAFVVSEVVRRHASIAAAHGEVGVLDTVS